MVFRKEVDKIRAHVQHSFSNVKRDTTNLYDWVLFLHQRIEEQEKLVVSQQDTISHLHKQLANTLTPEAAQELIAGQSALQQINQLQQRIQQLHKKMSVVADLHDSHHERINELHSRVETLRTSAEKKNSVLQEKLIKNIARNSKTYIKNAIVNYASKYEKISALQLKELVVDEQQLCSKSSFYRLLAELEKEEKFIVAREGNQKLYVARAIQSEA